MRQATRTSRKLRPRRRGAAVVEFAVIGPLLFLLLIGFAVLGMGVFKYQEVAYLARQGARYASIHGAQYYIDNKLPPGDQTSWTNEIKNQGVLTHVVGLEASRVNVTASWSAGNNRANAGDPATGFQTTINNNVTVTVTYSWMPEAFLVGPFMLSSASTVPMSY
jgi:Flp pilus assembly protein TadG